MVVVECEMGCRAIGRKKSFRYERDELIILQFISFGMNLLYLYIYTYYTYIYTYTYTHTYNIL